MGDGDFPYVYGGRGGLVRDKSRRLVEWLLLLDRRRGVLSKMWRGIGLAGPCNGVWYLWLWWWWCVVGCVCGGVCGLWPVVQGVYVYTGVHSQYR